ncbi:MAG: RrF2 family transcriptional regulator [Candidatus Brocadiia bacterium]
MAIIHRDTDYALRAMVHLAHSAETEPVSVLAEDESVPEDFLRKIMQRLKTAGLVESSQGPFGGYGLARSADRITLHDVVKAVQGPLTVNACFDDPEICENVKVCALRRRLGTLQKEIESWFDGINLADIAAGMQVETEEKSR